LGRALKRKVENPPETEKRCIKGGTCNPVPKFHEPPTCKPSGVRPFIRVTKKAYPYRRYSSKKKLRREKIWGKSGM